MTTIHCFFSLSILYLRCLFSWGFGFVGSGSSFNSLFEMRTPSLEIGEVEKPHTTFNSLFEMLWILDAFRPQPGGAFQFSIWDADIYDDPCIHSNGYVDFQFSIWDAGGSCLWLLRVFKFCWRWCVGFAGGFVDCGCFGFVFVLVCRVWMCVFLRVFSPRRRPALKSCTTI